LGVAFLAQAVLSYGRQNWILPKWLMIYGSALALFVLFVWRNLYSAVVLRAVGGEKVLFIGSSPVVFETARHIQQRPELGMSVLGYLDEDCPMQIEPPKYAPRLGCIPDLMRVVGERRPDRIVVGMRERRQRLPVSELLELRFAGITTEEVANLYEAAFGRVCAREIRPSHLIFSTDLGPRPHQVQIQSLYSTVIAGVMALLTLPLMAIVAVLVRLTSTGPILFRQTRIGLYDREFTLYKFRSMRMDAEAATGAVWATKDDPRVTPIGRLLRLLRLDELPQLFNVLRGEMSIVGPRPERPEFVRTLSDQIPYYRQRHCVKPGITGWAQINYKYGNTIEDTITKLEYDLYYIKNMSLSLDAYIIFHTTKTMLLFRGAH
jgi:sugar transferase (PEP-CTERM system associated)